MTNPSGPPRPPSGGHGQTAPSLSPDVGAEGTIRLEAVAPPGDASRLRYRLTFRNTKDAPLDDVRIWHDVPEGVGLLEADPPPSRRDGRLCWELGSLPPGAQQTVAVLVLPPGAEWLPPEQAIFHTSCTVRGVVRVRIRRPALDVRVAGPPSVRAGEAADFTIETENAGAGEAVGVTLQVRLSAGLCHPEGPTVTIPLGDLAPRALVRCRFEALAAESGAQRIEATVVAGEHRKAAGAEVLVLPPALQVRLSGPQRWAVGEPAELGVAVVSAADTEFTAVAVACTLPEGFEPLPDANSEWQPDQRLVRWELPAVAAGATEWLTVRIAPQLPGAFRLHAVARADRVEASAELTGRAEIIRPANVLDDLVAAIDSQVATPGRESGPANGTTVAGQRFVVFGLAGGLFALPLSGVHEISRPLPITPVPNMPDWLLGVVNVRGDIVSVVDLRAFLGQDSVSPGPQTRMLIVRAEDEDLTTTLLVDHVRGIKRVPDADFREAQIEDERIAPYVLGVCDFEGDLLVSLDLVGLLTARDMRQFEHA